MNLVADLLPGGNDIEESLNEKNHFVALRILTVGSCL